MCEISEIQFVKMFRKTESTFHHFRVHIQFKVTVKCVLQEELLAVIRRLCAALLQELRRLLEENQELQERQRDGETFEELHVCSSL